MSLTLELLRTIGSPFVPSSGFPICKKLLKLCLHSNKNKMLLLFLESIRKTQDVTAFAQLYENENKKYLQMQDVISKVSQVLSRKGFAHAIYKTIRPYKSVGADIDIIIFEDKSYPKSIKAIQNAGYKLLTSGPQSTTLLDPKTGIGIDLYKQVAVSYITYINKNKLNKCIITTKLPNGKQVRTLKPEADLACIIAHSLIKEQMYLLSEYYTFIYYLEQIDIKHFLEIVKQNNITFAVKTHTLITALFHKVVHKTVPKKLQRLLNALGEESFETNRLIKKGLETPFKYHPITIVKSLLEISKENEIRKSIGSQLIHMLNPNVSREFLEKVINHIKRETY